MKFIYSQYKALFFIVGLVFSITALNASSAEIRTVIPPINAPGNEIGINTSGVIIKYDLRSIPSAATITSCTIQFRLNRDVAQRFSFLAKTSKGNLGYLTLFGSEKKDELLEIEGASDVLQIGTQDNITYSVKANNDTYKLFLDGKTNWAPRLIITYTLHDNNIPQPQDWVMSRADASRSGRSFMRFRGATPSSFSSVNIAGKDERKVTGKSPRGPGTPGSLDDIQTGLIMFNNRVLLVNYTGVTFELLAIDPITGAQQSIAGDFRKPVAMPVIDRFGHLFYFGENGIQAYNIGKDFTLSGKETISIDGNTTLDHPPVVGPDGSLYLGFNNGIRSYSPFPALDLQWQYQEKPTDKYSSVALNKKGTKAYFVMQNKNKLVGINTTNGVEVHKAYNLDLPPPSGPIGDELIGQTIPLVTNKGLVFVANKLSKATKMYIFSEDLLPINLQTGINISLPAEGWPDLLKGQDRTFFVNNGVLMECIDGYCTVKASLKAGITVRSLITDQSDNVYCLSDSPNQLFVWTNGAVSKSEVLQFNPPLADIAFRKALILGPDGSAYTATSNSLYGFRATYPTNSTYNLGTEKNTELNNYAFKAESIVVPRGYTLSKKKYLVGNSAVNVDENVVIDGEGDITIESGGTISFGKGFKVKKGATLSCKTGY